MLLVFAYENTLNYLAFQSIHNTDQRWIITQIKIIIGCRFRPTKIINHIHTLFSNSYLIWLILYVRETCNKPLEVKSTRDGIEKVLLSPYFQHRLKLIWLFSIIINQKSFCECYSVDILVTCMLIDGWFKWMDDLNGWMAYISPIPPLFKQDSVTCVQYGIHFRIMLTCQHLGNYIPVVLLIIPKSIVWPLYVL